MNFWFYITSNFIANIPAHSDVLYVDALGVEFLQTVSKFIKRKKIISYILHKHQIRNFVMEVVQRKQRKEKV